MYNSYTMKSREIGKKYNWYSTGFIVKSSIIAHKSTPIIYSSLHKTPASGLCFGPNMTKVRINYVVS